MFVCVCPRVYVCICMCMPPLRPCYRMLNLHLWSKRLLPFSFTCSPLTFSFSVFTMPLPYLYLSSSTFSSNFSTLFPLLSPTPSLLSLTFHHFFFVPLSSLSLSFFPLLLSHFCCSLSLLLQKLQPPSSPLLSVLFFSLLPPLLSIYLLLVSVSLLSYYSSIFS